MEISRHFVTLKGRWGTRQVHYRRAGQGPAVLLLHQSPQSSAEFEAPMRRHAREFTLIAPDTPGYGQSDPLGPDRVSIGEFAAALGEFVDALGLRRFGVYGFHTGACIGTWLAAARPQQVTAVSAQGLPRLTEEEQRDIVANYLPPFLPSWDGSHLAWLWSRTRGQLVFYPWYRHSAEAAISIDMPDATVLHAGAMELMRAGDHYATAYRAAFESDPRTVLPGLRARLLVTAGDADPLREHFGRLGDLPAGARVEAAANSSAAFDLALEHLRIHPGDAPPSAPATAAVAQRWWRRMITTPAGPVHLRLRGGSGRPLVLVHGAGECSDNLMRLGAQYSGPLVLPDLPGHGISPPQDGDAVAAGAAVLDHLLDDADALVATGAGAAVALSTRRTDRPLTLIDVPALGEDLRQSFATEGFPDLSPVWHGGHLQAAWQLVGDSKLHFPWFRRDRAHRLAGERELDPRRLQLEMLALFQSVAGWPGLGRTALDFPWLERLRDWRGPLTLAAPEGSGLLEPTRALAGGHRFVRLPRAPDRWLQVLVMPPEAD